MMKFITTLGACAVLALGFASSAQAGPVGGSQHQADNSCFIVWWFFVDLDCSYDASRAAFVPAGSWVGPLNLYSNYLPGGFVAGDDSKRLRFDGTMTVTGEFGGPPSGVGDVIDAALTIAAGERVGSCGQGGDCLVSWDAITHNISAAADRATANSAGGYTYEVAANAFPARLEPCVPYTLFPFPPGNQLPFNCVNVQIGDTGPIVRPGSNFANQLYPSVTASPTFPAPLIGWQASAPVGQGVSSFEGGRGNRNTGVPSTALVANGNCTPLDPGSDCSEPSVLGSGFPPVGGTWNYQNVLMKVDTNAAGGIINAELSVVHEYVLVSPAFGDSWDGNWVELSGYVAVLDGTSGTAPVDKKGVVPIVIYGADDLDVRDINPDSLRLGRGLFYTQETFGVETHGKAHYGDVDGDGNEDITAHFRSNESDLRCGQTEIRLLGESSGVPFATTVTITGVGKACDG
jgi:hypothetical protein